MFGHRLTKRDLDELRRMSYQHALRSLGEKQAWAFESGDEAEGWRLVGLIHKDSAELLALRPKRRR